MNARLHRITLVAVLAAFATLAGAAQAADLKISCEKRGTRSKVSVDGNNLRPGAVHFAIVSSGGNQAQSGVAAVVGDEIEFDFDSNPADIAQGATPIAANFIVDGRVSAQLRDAGGNVVATGSAICRVRR